MADNSALSILQMPLIKGNPANALTGVNKIVLSEKAAQKYFGNQNPIGKTLLQRGRRRDAAPSK